MPKRLYVLLLCLPLLLTGCPSPSANTPPLAPGYTNQADQTMGESLAAARAFYVHLQQDAVAGTFKPSPAEKEALNKLSVAINMAEPLYLAFHGGTGSQQAAQSAVDNVVLKQSEAQALSGGK